MISIYCAVGALCGIFLWIEYLRLKKFTPEYHTWMLFVWFFVAHMLTAMMKGKLFNGIYCNIIIDIIFFALFVCAMHKITDRHTAQNMIMFYNFNPIVILSVISGEPLRIILCMAAAAAVVILYRASRKKGRKHLLIGFLPEYILTNSGLFFLIIAHDHLKQTFKQCLSYGGDAPTLLIASLGVLIIAVILIIRKVILLSRGKTGLYHKTRNAETAPIPASAQEPAAEHINRQKFTKGNLLVMLLITLIYGLLVFYQLGAYEAPETYYKFNSANAAANQVTIDLQKKTELSKISFFSGYDGKKKFKLAYWDEAENNWMTFTKKKRLEDALRWNDVEVKLNKPVRYLQISSLSDSACINEIVVLDDKGKQLKVKADADKKPLFDEQKLYPQYSTYYYGSMFDEIYHARTAYETLNHLPIYEITHPPLGKNLIAIGIKIFGMNPFGWRFICALCGILMVPIIYLFSWKLWRNSRTSLMVTGLFCFEFMHFTLSRIATLDIIVGLLALMMFFLMYCFLDQWWKNDENGWIYLLLCGWAAGCGIAVKWTGLYAGAGLALIFFYFLIKRYCGRERKLGETSEIKVRMLRLFAVCVISFIAVPMLIYIASYIPYTKVEGSSWGLLQTVIENAKFMLSYHESTVFDHPYSSEWYTWIIDQRPLLDSVISVGGEKVSTVATFGNPVILWGGAVAVLYNIYLWKIKSDRKAAFLVLAYLSMLLPWLFIHRTVFIYQYFICIVLLVLLIGNTFENLRKWRDTGLLLFTEAAAILFIGFFPVLSGFHFSVGFIAQVLEWFGTWTFV